MVVPYRHVAGLDELTADETVELMSSPGRRSRRCAPRRRRTASTSGSTSGDVAGGSLADHLHQHVVPRWGGDANFITVLAGTKVIPQLLAETRDLIADAWK